MTTTRKQPAQGQKQRQNSERRYSLPGDIDNEGDGFYQAVREDGHLRAHHLAKLLSTPGYGHLSEEDGGEMVDQMLRLSTLLYGMLRQENPSTCL
ncbi:hypothetical protein [Rufibacter immobilis]|uniref:hypothetical protein n=1 Tax=Rufibacter immobilis TaxID=1348778 RepID=UPI0035ED61B7